MSHPDEKESRELYTGFEEVPWSILRGQPLEARQKGSVAIQCGHSHVGGACHGFLAQAGLHEHVTVVASGNFFLWQFGNWVGFRTLATLVS